MRDSVDGKFPPKKWEKLSKIPPVLHYFFSENFKGTNKKKLHFFLIFLFKYKIFINGMKQVKIILNL